MASKTLNYSTKVYIPIATGCCPEVAFCLPGLWADRTTDGLTIVFGTIQNEGRQLTPGPIARAQNPRCLDLFQYVIEYDDAQFLTDPETDEPFLLTCSDISEVNPYVCTLRALLALIEED